MPDWSQVRPYSLAVSPPQSPTFGAAEQMQWEQLNTMREAAALREQERIRSDKARALAVMFTDEKSGRFDREGYVNALRTLDPEMSMRVEKHFEDMDKLRAAREAVRLESEQKQYEIVRNRIKQAALEIGYIDGLLNRTKDAYEKQEREKANVWYSEALRAAKLINAMDEDGNWIAGIDLPPQYTAVAHDIVYGLSQIVNNLLQKIAKYEDTTKEYASQIGVQDEMYIEKIIDYVKKTDLPEETKARLIERARFEPAAVQDELDRIYRPALSTKKAIPAKTEERAALTGVDIAGKMKQMKLETAFRKKFKALSGEQATQIANAYQLVKWSLQPIKTWLEEGRVDMFDITAVGDFKNPQMKNAYMLGNQIILRLESGKAVTEREWKALKDLFVNKQQLLTPSGRQAIIDVVNSYIDKCLLVGKAITMDPEWYIDADQAATQMRHNVGGIEKKVESEEENFNELKELLEKYK